jgi:hypothetical protein
VLARHPLAALENSQATFPGYLAISYNSCRIRHYPKCQSLKQAKWIAERLEWLLPTHYFHLVITLPHELNPLARFNPELAFNLLFFKSVSRALQQFARDYERLQAQAGFTAVLHVREQVLNLHPHLHLSVTGGGLSAESWIAARNSFLLPVRALSKIIRAKFLEALQKAIREERLKGKLPCLADPAHFQRPTGKLRGKKCLVYAKVTFDTSQNAYHYPSRYTHRVAISNRRPASMRLTWGQGVGPREQPDIKISKYFIYYNSKFQLGTNVQAQTSSRSIK